MNWQGTLAIGVRFALHQAGFGSHREDLRHIKELLVQRGKEMLIEAAASLSHGDDDSSGDDQDDGDQLSLDSQIRPADWPEGKNWGTLISVDASCTPSDITYPLDLKLLDKARQSTERVIDDLRKQSNGYVAHLPRYDRGKAPAHCLNVAVAARHLPSSSRKDHDGDSRLR